MKLRPVTIVIIICLLGIAVSATSYLINRSRADEVFAGDVDVRSLQRMTENGDSFAVYFYGRSCEDCAASEPYLVQALEQAQADDLWPEGLDVYKCEREANATVRSLYGVEQTPTLVYFRAGAESARLEGPLMSAEEYGTFFASLEF